MIINESPTMHALHPCFRCEHVVANESAETNQSSNGALHGSSGLQLHRTAPNASSLGVRPLLFDLERLLLDNEVVSQFGKGLTVDWASWSMTFSEEDTKRGTPCVHTPP